MCVMNNQRARNYHKNDYRREPRRQYNPENFNEQYGRAWNPNYRYKYKATHRYFQDNGAHNYNHRFQFYNDSYDTRTNTHRNFPETSNRAVDQNTSGAQQYEDTSASNINVWPNNEVDQNSSSVQQHKNTSTPKVTNETNESMITDQSNIRIRFPNPWLDHDLKNLNSSKAGTSDETKITNEDTGTHIPEIKKEKTDIKVEKEISNDSDSSSTSDSLHSSTGVIEINDSDHLLENDPPVVSKISNTPNNISQTESLQGAPVVTNSNISEIVIHNLPNDISETDILKFYERYGEIEKISFSEGLLNACRILYKNAEDARKSTETNGLYYRGRNFQVRLTASRSIHSIFVSNCPRETTEQDLYDVFEPCGPIQRVSLRASKDKIKIAFVFFEMEESVDLALLLNNFKINRMPVNVEKSLQKIVSKRVNKTN